MWEIYKSGSTRGEWVASSRRRPLSYSTGSKFFLPYPWPILMAQEWAGPPGHDRFIGG